MVRSKCVMFEPHPWYFVRAARLRRCLAPHQTPWQKALPRSPYSCHCPYDLPSCFSVHLVLITLKCSDLLLFGVSPVMERCWAEVKGAQLYFRFSLLPLWDEQQEVQLLAFPTVTCWPLRQAP